ncbi:MAG TPA: tetratricopeptide repeat protein [Candidatus Binatia bacterium]|nr:tetratricopeptide repeat protein [Candidatus Binatia bacterium]
MKRFAWKWPQPVWICLALAAGTLALYSPSLTHDFLTYDDQQYVTENPHVRAGLTWPGVAWAFKNFYASNWHPLTWLSHMLDYQLYGLHPAGHHLTNVLFHAANTVLLFLVLNRMTGARGRSACVAALFAWHPLHVESVAWLAERKDVLSAFFFFLTLLTYARYAKALGGVGSPSSVVSSGEAQPHDSGREITHHASRITFPPSLYYLLALLFFALGLMSKPMLVTLPFVFLLLDFWPLARFQIKNQKSKIKNLLPLLWEKVPFFAFSAADCVATFFAQKQSYAMVSIGGLSVARRFGHALVSYAHYLGAMLLPRHLVAYCPYPAQEGLAEVIAAGLLLALLSVLAFRFASRCPYALIGWLWFLGMLVPVLGLVQVGDQAWADRYTYLPLVGLFIALVWGAAELARGSSADFQSAVSPTFSRQAIPKQSGYKSSRVREWFLGVLAAAIGLGLAAGTSLQLRYWKDTRRLFEHALQVTPNNGRSMAVVGAALAEEGNLDGAMRLFDRALTYDADNAEVHFHIARVLEKQGHPNEAIAEYGKALWFRPLRDKVQVFLGLALARQGKLEEAKALYQQALALNPESAGAENNLARVLHTQGRLDEAMAHYSRAVKLDPDLAEAHNNLGVLLLQKNQAAEGAAQLQAAVKLNPANPESLYNLALAFNQLGKWSQAAALFSHLAAGKPNDPRLHCEFGLTLAHLGKTREALSEYAQALLLQNDYLEALDRLSWILATDPRPEFRNGPEAVRMAERACELTGNKQAPLLMTLAATYAEAGRFQEATQTVQKAQALAAGAAQTEVEAQCRKMLEELARGKPWRDPVSGGPVRTN